jgi:arginyl-tRNA synthetase
MHNITKQVGQLVKKCIEEIFPSIANEIISVHRGIKSDYQFTQISMLAKILKLSPEKIADEILKKLSLSELVESVKTVKTKTHLIIIFNISRKYLTLILNEIYQTIKVHNNLPMPMINFLPKNIIVDVSSSNIAKEMDVSHLRSTIIGESLCRIFEYFGCNVKRINHTRDWDTHCGMLIAYIKKFNIDDYDLPKLMNMCKASRKLFDTDIFFNSMAHIETVKLQQGNAINLVIWEKIYELSMTSFNKIYEQLQIKLEIRGQSFYQPYMTKMVEDLENILVRDDGMKLLFGSNKTIPLVIVKSDGAFTYDASDLAAIRYRTQEEKADLIVYVADSGQQKHFEILFDIACKLGWASEKQLTYVGFGLVVGLDGKKLTSGSENVACIQDLLNQAYDHSKILYHPDPDDNMVNIVSRKIAINCIKYAILGNPRMSNYKFDAGKMVNLKGNTLQLMYVLVRCKAILRKVPNVTDIINGDILVDTDEARNLAFKIAMYGEVITDTINQLSPHYICNYLCELVGLMNKFYQKNRCIEFSDNGNIINKHRICMVNLIMILISKLFGLVGLEHIGLDQIMV